MHLLCAFLNITTTTVLPVIESLLISLPHLLCMLTAIQIMHILKMMQVAI